MTIAVIGLGGAGGNIANEASKLGLNAGAVNFSQMDLDSLESIKHKLKIMGSEGVGHNREIAIELMQEHYDMVVTFIKDHFSNPNISVIAVAFSTGGGSGSGIAPILLDILINTIDNKVFVAIPILPDTKEVTISQLNTIKTFEELMKLDLCILPVDNSKSKHVGKNFIFQETNTLIANKLHEIVSYTEKHSKNGNFDRKDLTTLFDQRGIGIISEIEITKLPEADITPEGIAASIQESWDNSIFVQIEYDYVSKAAILFDGQDFLMSNFNNDLIFDKFNLGKPIDIFEGNYHEKNGRVTTILTGLPFCRSRFNEIEGIVIEGRKNAENTIKSAEKQGYDSKFDDFSNQLKKNQQQKVTVSDLLLKYKR